MKTAAERDLERGFITRFPSLYAFLTGAEPERKAPPEQRRGSGNHALNATSETPHMVALFAERHNKTAPPPSLMAVDARPLEMIIREGRMEIDAALAARILEEACYERQRPLRTDQLKLLASKMTRRVFHPSSTISFGLLKGRLYLINGQHRMSAVAETGLAQSFHVAVEPVETEAALHALYWTYDRGVANRSPHDVLTAAGVAEKVGLTRTMASATYNAMPLIINRFQRPRYQTDPVGARCDDARLKAAAQWWGVASQYEALASNAYGPLLRKLKNPQVVAVALVTLRYQPEKAAAFWEGIAKNDGLRLGDARKALVDTLMGDSHNGSAMRLAGLTSVAWNKWFAGDGVRILRFFSESHIRIAGTPFGGR